MAIPILFSLAYRSIWPLAVYPDQWMGTRQEVVAPAAYLQCKESGVKILSKKAADELIGAAGGVPKCVLHLRRDLHAALRERENLVARHVTLTAGMPQRALFASLQERVIL